MSMSVTEQIEKIIESSNISEEELKTKIEAKMKSLGNLISEEGAVHIIANELGVQLHSTPSSEITIDELTSQMKSASLLTKVIKKYEVRTFGEGGKVGNLFVGDASGVCRLTFWNDKTKYLEGIQEGDVVLIQNAYTKENNGRIEVHMGNASHCIVNPPGRDVVVKQTQPQQTAPEKKLNEITDQDTFVNITATIVQLYDPRYFESCPVCNKRLRAEDGAFACAEHGTQEPQYNYVLNLFLDDGSDNLRATLWKEQIQQLFSKSNDELVALKDQSEPLEELKNAILGRIIKARARVRVNEQYNNKELVLYDIDLQANPLASEATSAPVATETLVTPASEAAPVAEPSVNASANTSGVEEELFSDDDEELLSIDDLEESL